MLANPSEKELKALLERSRVIAVVGLSPHTDRPSYEVAAYLQKQGYRIVPVNPGSREILGEKVYGSLSEIPERVDIVDIFRRAEQVGPIIDEAIKIKAPAIWLQLGIRNDQEARKALEAGLMVIQDKCILREHRAVMV